MPSSYDQVPYPSLPVRRAHPSHLAAIASLFGMNPAPPARCRILEMGCASGDNLLPLAVNFPESDFVGIDLSSRQVAVGHAVVDELRLSNLRLHALDLQEIDDRQGLYDYIVCHGVFSWVPRPVQDRILEVGCRLLAPNGVFFVSYNTYPGWHLRGVVRDMMAYHVRELTDPLTKVSQARALLDFLIESSAPPDETYRQLLSNESAILKSREDGYLYHEHLEDTNQPFYFYQFLDRVDQANLQYLGDTDVASMLPMELGDKVASLLKQTSLLQQEQYLDFLRNRMFRGSILCHSDIQLKRHIESLRWRNCDIGLEEPLDISRESEDPAEPLVCETAVGRVRATSPVTRAALQILAECWPGCVSFESLLEQSFIRAKRTSAAIVGDDDAHRLARDLLTLYLQKLVRVWKQAPPCAAQAGDYPLANPLARWQARRGTLVYNQRHEAVRLPPFQAHLLMQLDGSRSREDLQSNLRNEMEQGKMALQGNSADTKWTRSRLDRIVITTLDELAQQALLLK